MKRCNEPGCLKEVIHQGGKNWCPDHLFNYDSPIIHEMLQTNNEIIQDEFFIYCFKTIRPSFSLFPLLYSKFPEIKRGKWLGIKRGFSKPQKQYLNECFEQWLKEKFEKYEK